ncbi:MAG: TonB-dependent receptor domain-containing protein, partial [Saprospiraceae bacterium]
NDGYRENNNYNRHNISLVNTTDIKSDHNLSVLFNYTDLKAFIPSSLDSMDYADTPTQAAFTWGNVRGFEDYTKLQTGISFTSELGRAGNFFLANSVFGTFFNSYESRPFNILEEKSQALGFRSTIKYEFNRKGRKSMILLGTEYFNEKYDWQTFITNDGEQGNQLSDNLEKRQYANIFLSSAWRLIDNLKIEAGLNLNITNYNYTDKFVLNNQAEKYNFNTVFSPRLGLNYRIPDKEIYLFGNVSHGFNAPTLEETLTPDGNINPDIQPETGWNYEMGSKGGYKDFKYNASIYFMDVRNLLVADRIAPDQFVGINAGRTSHFGMELELEYRIDKWEEFRFRPFLNYHYSQYKFKEFIDDNENYSGNDLTGTIPHKINAGIKWNTNIGLSGVFNYSFVDGMPMRDDNSIYSNSHQLLDFKIQYEKRFGESWTVELYTGIKNIWNEKYASMILINAGSFGGNAPRYYYPGLPRNFYGGVSLKYYL